MRESRTCVENLMLNTRQCFYRNSFEEVSGNQKETYKLANHLLHRSTEPEYPAHDCPIELCNRFGDFFSEKVDGIIENIEELQKSLPECPVDDSDLHTSAVFSEFKLQSDKDVSELVSQSATKSCSLDPLPTNILKQCVSELLQYLKLVINTSLSSCIMPEELKEAALSPLLKKLLLDPDFLKHFRPISNLPYLSKLVEKTVDVQLVAHCIENGLEEIFQSAYKQFYSTETALLYMHNDFMLAIDMKFAIELIQIDMTAAFDTVNHRIMLQRLQDYLGITGNALEWFRSYLSYRKQTVHLKGQTSTPRDIKHGVPQGSILGPRLFTIYTLPVGHIIRKYYPYAKFMFYADDKNLYLIFDPGFPALASSNMEPLIADVRAWLIRNYLMVNDTKTDSLVASSRFKDPVVVPPIRVGNDLITPSESVKNLGFIFDKHLTYEKQVNSVVRGSFLTLRDMYKIRQSLPQDVAESMVHSFITSRLDYCNSLYYGLPKKLTNKLQGIQNTAARLITNTLKYEHITPILKSLHWLPVDKRIIYKLLLITFKCIHGKAPKYLQDLLILRQNRGLRRDNQMLLVEPRSRTVNYGDRAFSNAAPRVWNALPTQIRLSSSVNIFKCKVKTFLFKQAY